MTTIANNLQPLELFVESYVKGKWSETKEFLLYNGPQKRFRIIVENSDEWGMGVWRDEKLAEQGINGPCEDAKEFANNLLNTLFYYLSPHEQGHIIRVLQADMDKWQAERVAAFPELAGDGICPY